ncbi:hypothetical protein [Streptomyces sp. NPDC047315]|uniref:hypothetical protein n=1 Tax=Streptomyces sp. NPDC047315 TaxID=3155142 RepID=UPI0033C67A91
MTRRAWHSDAKERRRARLIVAMTGTVTSCFVTFTSLVRGEWWPGVILVIACAMGVQLVFEWPRLYDAITRRSLRAGTGLSGFAAVLAGRHRDMRQVWLADLAGDPENDFILTPWQRRRMAAGFVVAAVRMRAHDLLGWVWAPVDWVLLTDRRRNAAITVIVGAQAVYIVGDGGLEGLVTEVWEPCGIAGAALYVLSRFLRRVRGIELAASNNQRGPQS